MNHMLANAFYEAGKANSRINKSRFGRSKSGQTTFFDSKGNITHATKGQAGRGQKLVLDKRH